MYLFDASALVNMVKRGYIRLLADGSTLDLAIYEALNAVWKEYKRLGRIDRETAMKLASIIIDVIGLMNIEDISSEEMDVYKLAIKEDLTIYDAAYLKKAIDVEATLVTDDKQLKDIAGKYVKTITTAELTTT